MADEFLDLPLTASNRPQLSRIAYTVDDAVAIRARLLERMAERFPQWNPALAENAGDPDFAVLFAELYAHMASILNRYSDARINEGFLRTATLETSLIDLAAMVDYRLAPGASATGLQAFLAKEPGLVPAAFKVQMPGAGDQPTVIFETETPLSLLPARNQLYLKNYNRSDRTLNLRNASNAVQDTSVLLDSIYASLKAGAPMIFEAGVQRHALPLVSSLILEGKTKIAWAPGAPIADADLPIADLKIHARPKTSAPLFAAARAGELTLGSNVLPMAGISIFDDGDAILISSEGFLLPARIVSKNIFQQSLAINRGVPTSLRRSATHVLKGVPCGLVATRVRPGSIVLTRMQTVGTIYIGDYLLISDAQGVELASVAGLSGNDIYLSQPTTRALRPFIPQNQFSLLSNHSAVFLYRVDPDLSGPQRAVRPLRLNELSGVYQGSNTELELDKAYEGLLPDALIALADGTRTRVHRILTTEVAEERSRILLEGTVDQNFRVADMRLHGDFEYSMRVDGYNISEAILVAGTSQLEILGTGLGLEAGNYLLLEDGIAPASGLRITQVAEANGNTLVSLARPLEHDYALGKTLLYGNVAPISHGASMPEEILGSGDPNKPNQRFLLRKTPLAFAPQPGSERGVAPELEIYVGEERWTEVASLADSGPQDKHYAVEIDEEQRATVVFGDGVHGAAPASGRNNLRARVRIGLGLEGNAAALAIKQMPQPLPFIDRVFNVAPAGGGADRETVYEAKRKLAHRVRTLDRAVSLADYADLALNFASVAKARADYARAEGSGARLVLLTVAGAGGSVLNVETKEALYAYFTDRTAKNTSLNIRDARRIPIKLALQVRLQSNFLQADVLRRLLAALGGGIDEIGRPAYFSFERRDLGADLYLSEIYALVEGLRGVDNVLATTFHIEGQPAQINDRIRMDADAWASGGDAVDATIGRLNLSLSGGLI
ncbi:MAG TPA: putative baseplate assembly protein [Burkholderiales bacterium]|nr:putative baseplate assembly protein [Burkholderiales bacterium]